MQTRLIWIVAVMLSSFLAAQEEKCAGSVESGSSLQTGDCWKTAKTQMELSSCSGSDRDKADEEMNHVYKDVMDHYRKNSEAIVAIRNAQRAWIAFRDAQINSIYPDKNPRRLQEWYGTMFSMCEAMQFTKLTRERTRQLRDLLEGSGLCGHAPPESDH